MPSWRTTLPPRSRVEATFGYAAPVTPNPFIEQTSQRPLRALWPAAQLER